MSETCSVRVTAYAGCKGEERPVAFLDGGRKRLILDIEKRWVESDALAGGALKWHYQVKADDGQTYRFSYDSLKDQWSREI